MYRLNRYDNVDAATGVDATTLTDSEEEKSHLCENEPMFVVLLAHSVFE